MKDRGPHIETFSGGRFYPFDPKPDELFIDDIAHALARQSRFSGHAAFYSVAQHSVYVSSVCDAKDALWGLLHDGSEALIVDIPSPIKRHDSFKFYRQLEAKIMRVVAKRFGLKWPEPVSVHIADKRMVVTEARDLMRSKGKDWYPSVERYGFKITPLSPKRAEKLFLDRFYDLTGGMDESLLAQPVRQDKSRCADAMGNDSGRRGRAGGTRCNGACARA